MPKTKTCHICGEGLDSVGHLLRCNFADKPFGNENNK